MQNSQEYINKKEFFGRMITLYGRNVVVEILENKEIEIYKLHMSKTNKIDKNIKKILLLARERDIEITYHDKASLSRISKNAKQDQGVAIDIVSKTYNDTTQILNMESFRMIALDGIQNPQNLGMIIRSCAAGDIDGIILPKKNSAKISPLVVKASAGTLFKIPIYYCNQLTEILPKLKNTKIYTLKANAKNSIYHIKKTQRSVFILGNESDGVTKEVEELSNDFISIPMKRGVESLNVAITAALISFIK